MIRVLASRHAESSIKLGYPVYTDPGALVADFRPPDTILRWGTSEPVAPVYRDRQITTAEAVATNVDKLASLLEMREVVRVPDIYERNVPRGVRVVVRTRQHAQGEGFRIVTGPYTCAPDEYAVRFVDTPTEYRVWFACEQLYAAQRVPKDDVPVTECRSKWAYSWRGVPRNLGPKVLAAAGRIGLKTGAADVLYNEADNRYYFLELNSAPSLDHRRVIDFFRNSVDQYVASSNRNRS